MKKVRKISRMLYLKEFMSCWLIFYMCLLLPAQIAHGSANPVADALPTGFNAGTSQGVNTPVITPGVNPIMDITQTANQAIANWTTFDIGKDATVNIMQPGATAAILNRISDPNPTGIMGTLNANGRVFIINPAGIVFGGGAQINVTQLTASSLNLADTDFLNGAPYQFTDGEIAGTVKNYANMNSEQLERVALIGKEVINKGILMSSKSVIMAAGDTVTISETGGTVGVQIAIPEGYADDFVVKHLKGQINAPQVVLAAGDIWSCAYINAANSGIASVTMNAIDDIEISGKVDVYAEPGSPAVASADLTAGGDINIQDDIRVEASGDETNNATASIMIDAGGNINVTGTATDDTRIEAKANDSLNTNTASVEISALGDYTQNDAVAVKAKAYSEVDSELGTADLNQANVSIEARNVSIETLYEGWIDSWYAKDALVGAYAQNADINRTRVDLTATGDGEYPGNVVIRSGGIKDSALVEAISKQGSVNSAEININASGSVEVLSSQENAAVLAEASNCLSEDDLVAGAIAGRTNTATVNITAEDEVAIKAMNEKCATSAVEAVAMNTITIDPVPLPDPELDPDTEDPILPVVADLSIQNLTNTANVNITGGSVDVKGLAYCGDNGAEAMVKATAANEMKIDIDNWDYEAEVNINVANLENNAGVKLAANGEVSDEIVTEGEITPLISIEEPKINVEIEGDEGFALVGAEAYNTLNVEHKDYTFFKTSKKVKDATVNLTVKNLDNNANVDISSANGSVLVRADEKKFWTAYTADVEAEAYNVIETEFEYASTVTNLTSDSLTNTAEIGIKAAEDVDILAEDGGQAGVVASAWNELDASETADGMISGDNVSNTAGVEITAVNGQVKVKADCMGDCSEAGIEALAYNAGVLLDYYDDMPENISNTAAVDITAGDGLKVIGKDCGNAYIAAETRAGTDNTSRVTINTGGDVLVLADNGDASITASAEDGIDNTATIAIDAVGGDVKVIDIGGRDVLDTAEIAASAEGAYNSNTADVTINATAIQQVEEGKFGEETAVYGGDVKVIAKDGGKAQITAYAAGSEGERTNTANVTIHATGAEATELVPVKPEFNVATAESIDQIELEIVEETYYEGGNVKVIAEGCGSEAEIKAKAEEGRTNNADVLICAKGSLDVKGEYGGDAQVEAKAQYGETNTASVGIGAVEGIQVLAKGAYSDASIAAKAKYGYSNESDVIACTQGDLWVLALNGGEAEIASEAKYGYFADAYTGVCATGDILVGAANINYNRDQVQLLSFDGGSSTSAEIRAEAEGDFLFEETNGQVPSGDFVVQQEYHVLIPTLANAEVHVISKEGAVVVGAAGCSEVGNAEAGILSKAKGASTNTAYTGVAAGSELSPAALVDIEDLEEGSFDFSDIPALLAGDVIVKAIGYNSKAKISSVAAGGLENDAMTVICALGKAIVAGIKGGQAKVFAGAFGHDYEAVNSAQTKVYAGDGVVGTELSDDIVLIGDSASIKAVTPTDFQGLCIEKGEVVFYSHEEGDGSATVITDNYASRMDCPTCPPCPCEEGTLVLAQVAPLAPYDHPRIEGCPALTMAAALELGTPAEALQVAINNAVALNPSIQPCQACGNLVSAANILRDPGAYMADMAYVFNQVAPADAPFTPEMGAAIATAFAERADTDPRYASAMEYVDAFVQYVTAVDRDLGAPVGEGDSVAYVMNKYGNALTEDGNSNMAAYVMMQLQ